MAFGVNDLKILTCFLSLAEAMKRQDKLEEAMEMNWKPNGTLSETKGSQYALAKHCLEA